MMNQQPTDMLVEITNRCNHKCIFCAHQKMKMTQGEIDPLFLERILEEAYNMGVRQVGLYTTGEMFLCKHLTTHIQNAKRLGFEYIYSDTNGALATKDKLKEVFLAGLDSIKFSINAGTRETYQSIHGKDDFDTVLKNLADCHALRKELGLNYKIMVSYVITSTNENEINLLKDLTEPYIDEFVSISALTSFLQYPSDLSYLAPKHHEAYTWNVPCPMVFNRIHVTYDGFLTACCVDFEHDLLLADLKTTSLSEAWTSENARKLRERHLAKDLDGTMCYNCMKSQYHPHTPLQV